MYKPRVLFLNAGNTGGLVEMQSYPNCRTQNKTFVPDVRSLAEIFDNNGFDFNLVLLFRNPEDVTVSAIRRNFDQELFSQCRSYIFAIDSMIIQLESLDKSFVAGKLNLDDSKENNKREAKKLLMRRLNLTEDFVETLFKKFEANTEHSCITSRNENSENLLACRSALYDKFYHYKILFDRV